METLVNGIGLLSLTGLIATGVLGGGLGVVMGTLLVVGVVDGPRGGELAKRLQRADPAEAPHRADQARTPA